MSNQPWAFIAHKDGMWAGVASAEMPKRDLKKFIGEFVADGFAITTVFSRDEYDQFLRGKEMWRKSTVKTAERS